MSAEVVNFTGITCLDLPPERVLRAALEAGLSEVVVIGLNDEGEYFAASQASGPECLWHLERAKQRLLEVVDDQV